MVFIPEFRRQPVGVSPELPKDTLRLPPGAFQNQQFKALASLAATGLNVGAFLQKRQEQADDERDQNVAEGAYNRFYTKQTEVFNAARLTQGVNSTGVTDRFLVEFDDLANTEFLEFENDRQRDLYADRVQSLRNNKFTFISGHEAGQLKVASTQRMAAKTAGFMNEAAINFEHDGVYAENRVRSLESRRDQLSAKGIPLNAIEADLRTLNGDLQSQRISQLARGGNLQRAENLFGLHKNELSSKQSDTLRKSLDSLFFRERVQGETDKIISESGEDEESALFAAEKLSGKLEDDVKSGLRQHFRDERDIQSRTDKVILNRKFRQIQVARTRAEGERIAQEGVNAQQVIFLQRVNNSIWKDKNKPVQVSKIGLESELLNRIDKSNDGRLRETDPLFISDITDIEKASIGNLTTASTGRVRKYFEDGGEGGRLGLNKVISVWKLLNNKASSDKLSVKDLDDVSALREFVLERSPSGKDITDDDLLKLGNTFMVRGVIGLKSAVDPDTDFLSLVPFGIFDPKPKTFGEAVRTGREDEFFVRTEDVTSEERTRAIAILNNWNRKNPNNTRFVNEENIVIVVTRNLRGIGRALERQ